MKKLSFLFVLSILLVSTLLIAPSVSAWTSDRFVEDTQKIDDKSLELEKETTTKYGTYEIIDHKWWDVLKIWTEEKIKEVRLEENTDVCSDNCLAIKEITNLKPAPLIEDVRFLRDFGDGKWVSWNGFTNWRVLVEEDVEQFETICKDGKEIIDEKNGTSYFEQDCYSQSTGFVKQWLPLDFKKEYEGTYKVKLEGGKKESTILDWQVKTNGQWLESWAVWGGVIGVGGVTAKVTLNSPANGATSLVKNVTFNASANVTGGAYLTNMSFCSNLTGSWGCGDSFNIFGNLTLLNETSGISNLGSSITSNEIGVQIKSKITGNITSITVFEGGTSVVIRSGDGSTVIAQSAISSKVATFNNVSITQGTLYRINVKGGGNVRNSGTVTFPISRDRFNLTGGVEDNNGAISSTTGWGIAYIETKGISTTSSTQTWSKTIPAGSTKWNVRACDTDGDCGFSVANYTVSLDATAPTITINSGNGTQNYGSLTQNHTINFTVTDTNLDKVYLSYQNDPSAKGGLIRGVTDHYKITSGKTIANITKSILGGTDNLGFYTIPESCFDSGWVNLTSNSTGIFCKKDNSTIVSTNAQYGINAVFYDEIVGAVSGVMNSTSFALVQDLYNATIYANDTAGNLKSEVVSWDYAFFSTGESYNPTSTTTTVETFGINITTATAQIPVAYLVYNGTETLATRTGNTTNHIFLANKTMISAGTFNFYWRITYGSEELNTTANSQTVSAITAGVIQQGACPAGLTQVMNFTFANEADLSALQNMTVKYNFQYGVTNSTGAISSGTLTNVSQVSLCLNTTQSSTYQIGYGELDYSRDEMATRRYYVFANTRVSNQTINTTLYSLNSSVSTSFLVELRSPTLSPYVGFYTTLLRWYPNLNQYRVVEMGKTDDKGQTVKKVKIEDVDYRIGLYETDGTLVYLANPIRMVCLATPCSYSINVPTDATDAFEEVQGIEVDLSYTAGVFTLVYNDPSQNTEIMSLRVYKMGGTSERVVCESNGTSFTGILTCDVSSETGTLRAIAIRTASPERPLALLIIDTLTTVFTGTFGLFIQFLIIVTLAFLGIVSPVVAIIMALIALLLGVLVFKTFSYALLIGVALLGGIVIHLMKRSAGQ